MASLRYADLLSTLPSEVDVLAWPTTKPRSKRKALGHHHVPTHLEYAEDLLQAVSLPEGWSEIYQVLCFLFIQISPSFPTHTI